MKTVILTMMLMLFGAPGHAQASEVGGTHLKLPLTCVLYDEERGKSDPNYLTFTLEQGPSATLTGTIYYGGKVERKVDDMVIKGRLSDGRLVIGSAAYMFIELRLNEQTGLGILYNGTGQYVKCSPPQDSRS